jgi:uncharacterized protein (DUF342 family)
MEISQFIEELKAGSHWKGDGSIGLGEVDFKFDTIDGQLLATAEAEGVDPVPIAGKNVRLDIKEDGHVAFYAIKSGKRKTANNVISVEPMKIVEGDVGAHTGNIKAEGDLYIKGSVGQKYSIQAGGSVLIGDRVEEGAHISAKGSIIVGGRVFGRQTRLISLGDVFVQSVHESSVQCRRDLWFGEALSYANVRAGGDLKANSAGKGLVKGGETWALNKIEVLEAGSSGHESTEFTCGVDPVRARQLDEVTEKLEECSQEIMHQLHRFNMEKLDVAAIQARLATASGPQRQVLVQAARTLGKQVQERQALIRQRQTVLKESMSSMGREGGVQIWEKVFPGVKVNLGDQSHTVEDACDCLAVTFNSGYMEVVALP